MKTLSNDKFNYMLLSRLKRDCEYYLGFGNRWPGCLWTGDEKRQIEKMKELYGKLPVKPEWLTPEQIDEYARNMGVN